MQEARATVPGSTRGDLTLGEIDGIPPQPERRLPSPLGDRLMVGLAGLALVAGLLLASVHLLDGLRDGAAEASAGSSPSGAGLTATPRPLREVSVTPGSPPWSPQPEPLYPWDAGTAWLQATAEIVIRAAPDRSADVVDRLAAGTVLLVSIDPARPEWVVTADHAPDGWIETSAPSGAALAVLHPIDAEPRSGAVESVAAGPNVLVGLAWSGGPSDAPLRLSVISSPDGERWETLEVNKNAFLDGWRAAWGPVGWLAVTGTSERAIGVWRSADGVTWQWLGTAGLGDGWPGRFLGSELGYLLVLETWPGSSVWYSPDGITWQESRHPDGSGESSRSEMPQGMVAVDGGFVAWTVDADPDGFGAVTVAFSKDGRTWRRVPMDEAHVHADTMQVVSAGETLLVLAQVPGGTIHAWQAELPAGPVMRLERDPALDAPFAGMVSVSAASDGQTAFALGFDRTTFAAHVWRSDGGQWSPVDLPSPSPFGLSPRIAAVGPDGLVLVGTRPTAAGENPVFWHLRSNGTWAREADPVIELVPDPGADDCGPLPSTALEFVVLPPAWGPVCFGAEEMVFAAWVAPCNWCDAAPGEDVNGTPRWLMVPDLVLLPAAGAGWAGREVVLDPGSDMLDWTRRWVRVTGHYSDPAAESCRWNADETLGPFDSSESAVAYCREQFVVTEVTPADPPSWVRAGSEGSSS